MITIGQPGDPTNDATIPWPDGREQVDVGTLTLDHVESEETSPARDINFDPLVLPAGIAPSDDPLLSARSAVYSQSFTRRAGETQTAERDYAFQRAKVSMNMATEQSQFTVLMRFFHWLTAAMVLTMLGIGVAMVASLADYHRLVSIHRPLGILVLIVVVIRFVNRRYSTLPPFPSTMSPRERSVASASERFVVYAAVCAATGRLGDVVGGAVSDRAVRVDTFSSHTSAQRIAVRRVAEDAHNFGLPFISGIPRPSWSGSVSHAGRARWNVQPYGALESPRALSEFCQRLAKNLAQLHRVVQDASISSKWR